MPSFTTVVNRKTDRGVRPVVTMSNTAYDISTVVRDIYKELLDESPRASKCRTEYSLTQDGNGKMYRTATVILENQRGTELDKAVVYGEQPEVARKVLPIFSQGKFLKCECGNDTFYYIDRSLDYEHSQCSQCGRRVSNLTESGASA